MAAKKKTAKKKLAHKVAPAKAAPKRIAKKKAPPKRSFKAKVKTPKRSAKRDSRAPKPRNKPSGVKKGQTYVDNEERAGGPRKLVVERIVAEKSSADRWGNPRADRRYAHCLVIQNDAETNRRVRVAIGKLVEPAFKLEGAKSSEKQALATLIDDEGALEVASGDDE